jgi:hypothetical protein
MKDKSEQINEIVAAWVKARAEMVNPPKDAQGFGYKYTKLDTMIEMYTPILAKHKLVITQHVGSKHEGAQAISVTTYLMHESGQYWGSTVTLDVERLNKMNLCQSAGSNVTYLRRYSLAAMLCIASDDDFDASAQIVAQNVRQADKTKLNVDQELYIKELAEEVGVEIGKILVAYKVDKLGSIAAENYQKIVNTLEGKRVQS